MTASRRRLRKRHVLLFALLALWFSTAWWHTHKPLPPGLDVRGEWVPVDSASLQLLTDVTAVNNFGEPSSQQSIHAATLQLVHDAQDFLVLDYFLFNAQGGPAGPMRYERNLRPVAMELREALRALRHAQPELPILVNVDPINDYYRGSAPAELAALEQEGIDIVVTRLNPLRDSNPIYSTSWRLALGWWLKPGVNGRWSNPLDAAGPDLSLSALTRIPHFKANHRKLALTGDGKGSLVGIIGSANPHDGSSAHSNVALRLQGEALRPLLESELTIARWSGWRGAKRFDALAAAAAANNSAQTNNQAPTNTTANTTARARIATESAIRSQLLAAIADARVDAAIDIAQFYLSDRLVIEALLAAAQRGVAIRVLLDPNKDAFGFEKSGLPNREVASELATASDGAIRLRWYRTHGEQFHCKLAAIWQGDRLWLTLGSANFTRRNLGDYNLEANVFVDAPRSSALAAGVQRWFDMLWENRPGSTEYSADAEVYADPSQGRYWMYRLMEASGLSTF
jgi:PLD-like domain